MMNIRQRKNMNKIFVFIITVAALFASCSDEMALTQENISNSDSVSVSLNLTIDDMQPATRAALANTRSVDDGPTYDMSIIKNLWVLQFEGTGNSSRLLSKTYCSDFSNDYKIKLVDSGHATHTLVFLANTYMSIIDLPLFSSTLADAKALSKNISSEQDVLGQGETKGSGTSFPDDYDYHLMLYGTYTGEFNKSTANKALSTTMRFNVAKIKVTINNTSSNTSTPVTITGAQLRQVSNVFMFDPQTTDGTEMPKIEEMSPIDYKLETISGTSWTNSWYIPTNMRGKSTIVSQGSSNDSQLSKGLYAPLNATYLFVEGKYTASDGKTEVPVSYTYYLGSDLTDDYNLKAGCEYTYTVNINSYDAATSDCRVNTYPNVDFSTKFSEQANCYILNPAPDGTGINRTFTIPLSHINTFWGNVGYENEATYMLRDNRSWYAFIIWTDFDNSDNKLSITTASGTSASADNPGAFTVSVKDGLQGNALIGVRTSTSVNAVWSWHLWITDYNPYEADTRYGSPTNGRYVYPVTGGNVHTYTASSYTDYYNGQFVMDRNLGALSSDYVARGGQGVLFYQFGRKDPFPITYNVGNASYFNNGLIKVRTAEVSSEDKNVLNSVMSPTTFYYRDEGKTWTNNPTYSNSNYIWFDNATRNVSNNKKSLFDPCPPGYKVPETYYSNGLWDDFNATTTNIGEEGINRGLPEESAVNAVCYWPGTGTVPSTYIMFPLYGYMSASSGNSATSISTNYGSQMRIWASTRQGGSGNTTNDYSYCLRLRNEVLSVTTSGASYGASVRCVKE